MKKKGGLAMKSPMDYLLELNGAMGQLFNRQRWIIVAGISIGLYFRSKIKRLEEEVELLRKD